MLQVGDLTPTSGTVGRHSHISIGRYHQHSVDQLDANATVLDFMQVRGHHDKHACSAA